MDGSVGKRPPRKTGSVHVTSRLKIVLSLLQAGMAETMTVKVKRGRGFPTVEKWWWLGRAKEKENLPTEYCFSEMIRKYDSIERCWHYLHLQGTSSGCMKEYTKFFFLCPHFPHFSQLAGSSFKLSVVENGICCLGSRRKKTNESLTCWLLVRGFYSLFPLNIFLSYPIFITFLPWTVSSFFILSQIQSKHMMPQKYHHNLGIWVCFS